jgi:hypothetical protein
LKPSRKVDDLNFAERLVLWSIRTWMSTAGDGRDLRVLISETYRQLHISRPRISQGISNIETVLWTLTVAGNRNLKVGYVCHQNITEDEARLLQAIAYEQIGAEAKAQFLLSTLLPPAACRTILKPLKVWGDILQSADLNLPLREGVFPACSDGECMGPECAGEEAGASIWQDALITRH